MRGARRRATRFAIAVLPLALFAGPAAAQSDGPSAPIATLDAALTRIDQSGSTFAARAAALGPAVDGALDLGTILRNSVGLTWSGIPAGQQAQLIAAFRQFTLASYVSSFAGSNDRFASVPGTRAAGPDTIVGSTITPPDGGDATRIDYVMRQTPAGWRAVDVLVDGTVSRVAVQRSDFRSVLESGGPNGLLASLDRKVQTLSNGQMQP